MTSTDDLLKQTAWHGDLEGYKHFTPAEIVKRLLAYEVRDQVVCVV